LRRIWQIGFEKRYVNSMVNNGMRIISLKYAPLALVPLICIYGWVTYKHWRVLKTTSPAPYQILDDAMGTRMRIGVDSIITEQQLIATLSRAADDHQYDAARDLLISSYFSVEAYLLENGERSKELAGTIKRYVPPKGSTEHHDWMDWIPDLYGKGDKFSITLHRAKMSLKR
jgi:hypothetical protein